MSSKCLLLRRSQCLGMSGPGLTPCPILRARHGSCEQRRASLVRAAGLDTKAQATQVMPINTRTVNRDPTQPPCWIPPLIVVGLATLFSAVILKNRQRKPAVTETDEVLPIPPSPQQDPRSYQRALARTRQAAAVAKAIAFYKTGEPARAYMELGRALSENSICRSPLLDGHHTKAELVELYKLHLQNAEVPPNFATLLQLQEMLGLSLEEAEKIELDVMQTPGAFSI